MEKQLGRKAVEEGREGEHVNRREERGKGEGRETFAIWLICSMYLKRFKCMIRI